MLMAIRSVSSDVDAGLLGLCPDVGDADDGTGAGGRARVRRGRRRRLGVRDLVRRSTQSPCGENS